MTTTIAICTLKGGQGKSTSSSSLASGLTELGQRVLVVDLDPQGCLTFSLGLDPDELDASICDVLLGKAAVADVAVGVDAGFDLLPANLDLAGAEVILMSRTGREFQLRRALAEVSDDYDVVILDCPPSLGVLTINALTACDRVVMPVQCETLSHRGVGQILTAVAEVRALTNPNITVVGYIATMFDGRSSHAKQVLADVAERYELDLLGAPVRRSIRFAEAPAAGVGVLAYASDTPGAAAYRLIARQLAGAPADDDLVVAARWTAADQVSAGWTRPSN